MSQAGECPPGRHARVLRLSRLSDSASRNAWPREWWRIDTVMGVSRLQPGSAWSERGVFQPRAAANQCENRCEAAAEESPGEAGAPPRTIQLTRNVSVAEM